MSDNDSCRGSRIASTSLNNRDLVDPTSRDVLLHGASSDVSRQYEYRLCLCIHETKLD